MANMIRDKVRKNPNKRIPFGIFQAQLQLRLLCNHGTFQRPFSRQSRRDRRAEQEDMLYSLGKNAEIACSSCGVPIAVFDAVGALKGHTHICGHRFCQECTLQDQDVRIVESGMLKMPCLLCNTMASGEAVGILPSQSPAVENSSEAYFNQTGFSSKIEALMTDLQNNQEDTKR
jgi:hypothetical protein